MKTNYTSIEVYETDFKTSAPKTTRVSVQLIGEDYGMVQQQQPPALAFGWERKRTETIWLPSGAGCVCVYIDEKVGT